MDWMPLTTVMLGWIGLPFLISYTGCKIFARWQVNRSLGQAIR